MFIAVLYYWLTDWLTVYSPSGVVISQNLSVELPGQSNSAKLVRTFLIITRHFELWTGKCSKNYTVWHFLGMTRALRRILVYKLWYLVWLEHQRSSQSSLLILHSKRELLHLRLHNSWHQTNSDSTLKTTNDGGNPRVRFLKTEDLKTVYIWHVVTVVEFSSRCCCWKAGAGLNLTEDADVITVLKTNPVLELWRGMWTRFNQVWTFIKVFTISMMHIWEF